MVAILYQDDALLVCVKPIGVSAQSTPQKDGLCDLLAEQVGGEVYCVHRLDTATGGVMVYAKKKETATALSLLFSQNEVQKKYLAIVKGTPVKESDFLQDLLYHEKQKNRTYVVKRERKGVKEAHLFYQTLSHCPSLDHTLLQVEPKTGRTHQIRVQFATRSHPLFGDGKYGSRQKGTLGLWCQTVSFSLYGKFYSHTAPPPTDLFPWSAFFQTEGQERAECL